MAAPRSLGPGRKVLTSLPLEILFYFGGLYDIIFFVLTFLLFLYKGYQLPYPGDHYEMELAFLFLWALCEPIRIFLGSKGNKTESSGPMLWCVLLTVPLLALHVFYLLAQTYVLHIEQVLNGLAIGFQGLQALLGIFSMYSFQSAAWLA
jgi:transmembrane protein 216